MPTESRRPFRRKRLAPPDWLVVGVIVDYCAVIGEPPTAFNLEVIAGPQELGGPGGTWCVWLKGKSGCVSCDACQPAKRASFDNEGANAD